MLRLNGQNFRTFPPGSGKAMVRLSVYILVALIFHVILCGEKEKKN